MHFTKKKAKSMQLYILDSHGSVVWTYFSGEENKNTITDKDQIRVIKVLSDALQTISHKRPTKGVVL